MKIRTFALLAAITVPLTVHANLLGNLALSKKCHQLAISIKELSTTEGVQFCKNKISIAADLTELAAEDFIADDMYAARFKLNIAIEELTYTTVENCEQANNILLARNEVEKIYNVAR